MIFRRLAEYFQDLEQTSSRLKMMEILGELFKEAGPGEVDRICYLSLGRLGPRYETEKFQLAEKMVARVLANAFGVKEGEVMREYKKQGDLGSVALGLKPDRELGNTEALNPDVRRSTEGTEELSVIDVYRRLVNIAQESGEGSVERKINKMARLLNSLDSLSVKYVVRIPLGKLRLGFSDMTMIDGLSWMIAGDKSLSEEIREAYEVRADVGWVGKKLKAQSSKLKTKRGIAAFLKRVQSQVGVPVMPALCQRVGTAEEMIKKVGGEKGLVAVEPKFDGQRLQVHVTRNTRHETRKKRVKIFTRNLENVAHMFPEIVDGVLKLSKENRGADFILDGEAIGVDPRTGKFLPFQETIKRKRKHGVQKALLEIPLVYFVFDILFFEGKSWMARPFSERRRLLERIFGGDGGNEGNKGKKGVLRLTPQKLMDDPEELRRIHDEYIKKGLEGAVVKNRQAGYEPGRRGFTWVKFKQEEAKKGGGLADTIDCLVMGYYKGRGKRAAFGIGAFLVGVRVSGVSGISGVSKGDFVTVSKIGTGLTDEQWKKLKAKSSKLKAQNKPKEYLVNKNLYPDVWLSPGIVVEIEADNITKSPIHAAGLALRFPRLKRFRDDKGPEEVTMVKEIGRLYRLQFG